jgi:RIO-like serine/threonine protein kinase
LHYQPEKLGQAGRIFSAGKQLGARLLRAGIVHGDFNEFNLMLDKAGWDGDSMILMQAQA